MTDRWHGVAVITLSALRVLPGSCKRTLLSMALTPHRDMESAVTCMTTSSPGTAEDGENCSPTWHSDRTVDGVKIWCAGWKRNNKRWICSPFIRSDDDSTLFYLPCSPSVMEHRAEMRKTQLQQGDQGEFYLVPGIPGFDSNRFDLIFFFLFSVFEKETGRRCLPLVILGSSPWCICYANKSVRFGHFFKGLLCKVKWVVFSQHTLYTQYFRLSHHQRAHKENWKEHSVGFGFDSFWRIPMQCALLLG